MTMPVYVSPEQVMKDRADFARKGIARGRSVVVLSFDRGILLVAETASRTLHKISEIYDRVAFAAVGKYNEFENLRVAGVRYADLRGYSYDRSDVFARGLANAYAQTLGTVFTQESKPYEVEIAVAQVGLAPEDDEIYRLTYDGSVSDEPGYLAMGGSSEAMTETLRERHDPSASLAGALALAVEVLTAAGPEGAEQPRELGPDRLEVAVLDRERPRRTFRRLGGPLLVALLDPTSEATDLPSVDDARPGHRDELTQPGTRPTSTDAHSGDDGEHGHATTNPQTQQDPPHDGSD